MPPVFAGFSSEFSPVGSPEASASSLAPTESVAGFFSVFIVRGTDLLAQILFFVKN